MFSLKLYLIGIRIEITYMIPVSEWELRIVKMSVKLSLTMLILFHVGLFFDQMSIPYIYIYTYIYIHTHTHIYTKADTILNHLILK